MKKNKLLITINTTLHDCLTAIDASQIGIIFIVNNTEQVIGVVSDGDIRAHLLAGATLQDKLGGRYNADFVWADLKSPREDILKRLDKDIRVIPILDENKHLIDIASRDNIPMNYEKKTFARAKAPARVTFGGGGSDLTHYFSINPGAVVNATISLYSHVTLKLRTDKKIIIRSLDLGEVFEASSLEDATTMKGNFGLFQSLLQAIKPNFGFELSVHSDFPTGSGLGGSSVVAVAVIGCFNQFRQDKWDLHDIAELAFQAERLHLEIAGGWQDQYATVFGGFNFMEFNEQKNIVHPLRIPTDIMLELEESLLLFQVGSGRLSGIIHKDQKKTMESAGVQAQVKKAVELCYEMKDHLLRGRLLEFGKGLDSAWKLKRQFSSKISNSELDKVYDYALNNGALGGKLLGAGGGGFFLFFVKPFNKHSFLKAMKEKDLLHTPFEFNHVGMQSWTVRDEEQEI